VVFNEDGNDVNFRVESDSNTHMLFVDAGNNFVSIGSAQAGVSTSPLQASNLSVTAAGDAHHILIGNQDSGGTNTPSMIRGVNGTLHLGWGDSWTSSTGGTMTQAFSVVGSSPSVVANDDGADIDFRVESDTNTHALFVDAGNSAVGINNGSPAGGASGYTGLLRIGGRAMCYAVENDSVAASGTVDLTVNTGGGSFNGFLTVSNVTVANAAARTQATYSIFGRGTDSFLAQLIATDNGSSGGNSFTVTNPSTGVIRITNTSASTTSISAVFFGGTGF
jgi:hypothetical protein